MQRNLSVISAWCRRQSHKCIGKSGNTYDNPAKNISLKVMTARSAAFLLWQCGGTNWYLMSFPRNNSSVMWVWRIVMLGYQIYHLSLSTIMTLILISLEQAWYNCNHKGSIPIHKSLLWWTLRGTFPLDMCRVFLDQLQLQIPNVFSLLFPRGITSSSSISDSISLFWLFYSCVLRLLQVSFSNVFFCLPWDLAKLRGNFFDSFE